ncbi:MAG: rRNA maturation RNase YbeY [Nitrospirae bacterium]|nr:rRNA maturation RNase YbeY [Nitrospirota bacterium]
MIRVAISNRQRILIVNIPHLRRRARQVLLEMGFVKGDLSLAFVNDGDMRVLNATYRSIDRPTDVLAFAMSEGPFTDINPGILGDVVISTETALRQARRAGRDPDDEIDALLVHGVLHLIGYDHERSRSDARVMRAQERRLRHMLHNTG